MIHNLKQLLGYDVSNDFIMINEDKRYLNYDKTKQDKKIKYVTELVETMGFTFDNIGKDSKLSKEVFEENRDKCLKDCKIFNDHAKSEFLFNMKINELQSNKAFMDSLIHCCNILV